MNLCFFQVEYKIAMNLKLVKRVHCEFYYLGAGLAKEKGLVVCELRIIHEAESSWPNKSRWFRIALFVGRRVFGSGKV